MSEAESATCWWSDRNIMELFSDAGTHFSQQLPSCLVIHVCDGCSLRLVKILCCNDKLKRLIIIKKTSTHATKNIC